MPSLSPSPLKRPSIAERKSSTPSLSPSTKQTTHKPPRSHAVGRGAHTRQLSHGKNLSKMGRNTSTTNLVADANRNHQRQRSGTPPPLSPGPSPIKRNASHIVLPRNALSQVNLRKNHSATALPRNTSHPVLKKGGHAPALKLQNKKPKKKTSTFELGDSDDEEIEGEEDAAWEDSSISPELTRNSSLNSSQHKPPSTVNLPNEEKPPEEHTTYQTDILLPSRLSTSKANQSTPDLTQKSDLSPLRPPGPVQPPTSPALLQYNPRSARAPPAMSSILAHATNGRLPRTDSTKSFTHITHADAVASKDNLVDSKSSATLDAGSSSLADGGVSHFLSSSTPRDPAPDDADSDYDSPSNFLPNYHPQLSSSPEQPRSKTKSMVSLAPSRTQQRLELQRRETMRSSSSIPSTSPTLDAGAGFGSSVSLHSRSGSRGHRDRSAGAGGDLKAVKRDYDVAVNQLGVVRRFRNPVLEGLQRLKDLGILTYEAGSATPGGATSAVAGKRPPSRRGLSNVNGTGTIGGLVTRGVSRSFEEKRPSPMISRASSRSRGAGRVHFQRQGSHDDIGLSRSRGSYEEQEVASEVDHDEEEPGISAEEALLRRMWESRDVYNIESA